MPSASVMVVMLPAPRGSGVGHEAVIHLSQLDPQEFLDAELGGEFSGFGATATWGRPRLGKSQHAAEQRAHELLEGHDHGDRVARHADHRRSFDLADEYRLSRHDRHPVDEHLAPGFDHGPGVVLGSCGGSAHGEDHVGAAVDGLVHRLGDGLDVVPQGAPTDRLPAPFPDQPLQDEGVGLQHLSGSDLLKGRQKVVSFLDFHKRDT